MSKEEPANSTPRHEQEQALYERVYSELREMAMRALQHERAPSLSAGDLVNEVYLRLRGLREYTIRDRGHFLGVAAHVLRRVLVDHARARNRQKRAPRSDYVYVLGQRLEPSEQSDADLLALDEALEQLAGVDPRSAAVCELRYFGGLTFREVANTLNISKSTAESDWQFARRWLREALRPEDSA